MSNTNELGPTYSDVADYVASIREHWLHSTTFELVAPVKRGDEAVCGWIVRGYTWYNDGPRTVMVHAASASFGRGGGFRTMPAAMYNTLLRIWDKYEDAAAAQAELAGF